MTVKLDYVWLDGHTQKNLRSKIRFEEIKVNSKGTLNLKDIPRWSFDGSSTQQASSDNSDLILKPVKVVKNPLSTKNEQYDSFIVLCEVLDTDGKLLTPNTVSTQLDQHVSSIGMEAVTAEDIRNYVREQMTELGNNELAAQVVDQAEAIPTSRVSLEDQVVAQATLMERWSYRLQEIVLEGGTTLGDTPLSNSH